MLAQIAGERQQLGESARLLQAAAELDPSPQRLAAFVRSLQMAFDPAAGLERIEHMPEQLRGTLDLRALEAMLLGELGNHERELAIYEELILSHGSNPSVWMNYGNALKGAGRTDEALAAV